MTVRIGFLGAGFIATYHSKMLHRSGTDHRVVAVHDPDADRAAQFAAASGAQVVAGVDEVLEASDAVYVCTWTSAHPALVSAAAEAGRAVFCEKPLAVDLVNAERLAGAVDDAGVVNQVGLVLRDSPAFLALRALVQRPEHGAPMSCVFRDDQFLPVQGLYASTWRADPERAGRGTLLEHSIHDLDLIEWLFGAAASVHAELDSFHGLGPIEDLAVVTVRSASGTVTSLTSVWHDVLARPSQRRVEVLCERAHLTLEGDLLGPVRCQTDDDDWTVGGEDLLGFLADEGIELRNPDGAFVDGVAAARGATPDIADALRAHRVADAAYRSAATGCTVDC